MDGRCVQETSNCPTCVQVIWDLKKQKLTKNVETVKHVTWHMNK